MSRKFAARTTAVAASAVVLALLNAPAASAQTVHAATLGPIVGSTGVGTGSAAPTEALVHDYVNVYTNVNTPGVTHFGGSVKCFCLVTWVNEDTGTTGVNELPDFPEIGEDQVLSGRAETGRGRVRATVTVPDGTTWVTASGSWVVP
ncbi:hypothetical protein ACWPOB_07095 [Rhodococcus sp. 2H158]